MFINSFNFSKSPFTAPVAVGYNIDGYDLPILDRVCKVHGPVHKKDNKQALFSNFFSWDIMKDMWKIHENSNELDNLKFDTIREWLGLSEEGAHNALVDVHHESDVFIRLAKLNREFFPRVKFKGSFNGTAKV